MPQEGIMPTAHVNGVDLYYEETGQGVPLVWSHEFGGDHRSWEPQVRYFARRYRVITYNHRGYPPSGVPKAASDYSGHLVEDLHGSSDISASVSAPIGCSIGSSMARDFALAHPELTRSLMVRAGRAPSSATTSWPRRRRRQPHSTAGISAAAESGDHPGRGAFRQKDAGFASSSATSASDPQACAHLAHE
jgi:pimeloyl-ACP methyl ester carboxylesterase